MEIRSETTKNGNPVEVVEYMGKMYRRYPASRVHANRVYFARRTRIGTHGKLECHKLHQVIWTRHNGPIPGGFVVHHTDGDTANNDISNLELLTPSDHSKEHPESIRKAIDAARHWHGTAEGLKWHSKHGKECWVGRQVHNLVCHYCGKSYETLSPIQSKYCCNRCRSYARRDRGDDDIEHTCEKCGKKFSRSRYVKARFCSRGCSPGRPRSVHL